MIRRIGALRVSFNVDFRDEILHDLVLYIFMPQLYVEILGIEAMKGETEYGPKLMVA